jgi:broad specificity phosphatase PhoE
MKLILVRHGQTLWNREKRIQGVTDIELSNRGKAQADCLARSLRDEKIDSIVSSPLKRAIQTAEAINRFHHLPIEPEEDLMELNMGDFEGIAFSEMIKDHGDFLTRRIEDPGSVVMPGAGGESLADLQERHTTSP